MSQIKIYGLREQINPIKSQISDVIHSCIVDVLVMPIDKRFHRFFPLEEDDFIYPIDRSKRYTIIEINMISGRSVEIKKCLIKLLFERISREFEMSVADIEISIHESPPCNWGFRGQTGDEIQLNYQIKI